MLPYQAALIIDVFAVAGAAAGILAAPDDAKLPVLLLAAGLLLAAAVWMGPGWRYATGVLLTLTLVGTAAVVWLDRENRPESGMAAIIDPAEGEPVLPCSRFTVRVRGQAPPEGWAYTIGEQPRSDQRTYFEQAKPAGDGWEAEVSVEVSETRLWLVALDTAWAGYLTGVTLPEEGDVALTYWSSEELPPGAVAIHDMLVPLTEPVLDPTTGESVEECPEEP